MRVNDKDRPFRGVKILEDEPDQGLRGCESSDRAFLPLDPRRYGQDPSTKRKPEAFGVVKEAVDRVVRVLDG